ncbi:pyridoxal phosphate-dependent transferase [Mycena amicta]|nr:pyridoxal phosphate-dependent transferase [Mycena amicta]
MNVEDFRIAGKKAIDDIADYYANLGAQPVNSLVQPGYLSGGSLLPDAPPEQGEDFSAILNDYHRAIVPGLTSWQHPHFYAYFPTASSYEAILGDLYAMAIPTPGFNWSCSPAATELEVVVMDWAAKLLHLDPAFYNSNGVGGGSLQTTASDSALISIVAARERFMTLHAEAPPNFEDLVIYVTTQTHSLGLKAGKVLGLQVRALEVRAEDRYALKGQTLQQAIEEDKAAGRRPFVLIATVGTTSSGAVDDLAEIEIVLKQHPEVWIHVDAAWAGIALCCPETHADLRLPNINSFADSFCTNFHKWGLVNFDCSTLWVRDRKVLTAALDITPPFLRTTHGDAGTVIDYRNWHLALGRRFRSLKLFFVLRGFGVEGFRKHIRQGIELNAVFARLVADSDILELVTPPSLALSVFRVSPPGVDAKTRNTLNTAFYARLSARSDIALTQTTLNGDFVVRFAVGAARTTEAHIRSAFSIISDEARATLAA